MSKFYPDYYYYAGKKGNEAEKTVMLMERAMGEELAWPMANEPDNSNENPLADITTQARERITKKFGSEVAGKVFQWMSDILNNHNGSPAYLFSDLRKLAIVEGFRRSPTSKIFKVNKEFAFALSRMDVEFREELMPPSGFIGYFDLQKAGLSFQGKQLMGFYVRLGALEMEQPAAQVDLIPIVYGHDIDDVTAARMGVEISQWPKVMHKSTALAMPLVLGHTFGDIFEEIPFESNFQEFRDDYELARKQPETLVLFKLAINLMMYVHSLNPDVTELRPERKLSKREKVDQRRLTTGLPSSVYNVVLLNWSFGQGRIYSVDSTTVRSHLRWQPCGPGRSQTRLIIIEEHERNFKKTAPDG